ncbi:MAG: beta-propeller fold lactonase family protein [Tatlockia sp.]|nr:beta-propeller fold lactonase family protein [Tatlockia sp.]
MKNININYYINQLFRLLSFFCFFYSIPAFALIAYSPPYNTIVAAEKGSNTLWYKSTEELNSPWIKVSELAQWKGKLQEIVYAENKYLALADNATILWSPDGKHWQTTTSELMNEQTVFNALVHTQWGYVVVGTGTKHAILTSTDGFDWKDPINKPNYLDLHALAYDGDATVVGVGKAKIAYTPNGGSSYHFIDLADAALDDVTYGKDKFVAVGNKIYYSNNGVEWTEAPYSGSQLHKVKYVASTNTFVAVGDDNNIWRSIDGMNWTQSTALGKKVSLTYLDVSKPDHLVAGGDEGLMYSTAKSALWFPIRRTCGDNNCETDSPFKNFDSMIRLKDGKYLTLTKPVALFDTYVSANGQYWEQQGSLLYEGKVSPPDVYGSPSDQIAGMQVAPDGKHLYVTNSHHESWGPWYLRWYAIDPKDGSLTYKGQVVPKELPVDLVISPNGKHLYLGTYKDGIIAYQIEPDGSLTLEKTVTAKEDPIHELAGITMTADGKYLYSSHYFSLNCYRVNPDGSLAYQRQQNLDVRNLFIQNDGLLAYIIDIIGDIRVFGIQPDGTLNFIKYYERNEPGRGKIIQSANKQIFYTIIGKRYGARYIRELRFNESKQEFVDGMIKRAPLGEEVPNAPIGPHGVALSPNGKYLYTGSSSGRVHWFSIH